MPSYAAQEKHALRRFLPALCRTGCAYDSSGPGARSKGIGRLWRPMLVALFSVATAAHSAPLWQVERGSLTFFLLGSVHVLRAEDGPLPSNIDAAYDRADALLFETVLSDISTQELQTLLARTARSPDGRPLEALIGPDHWPGIVATARSAGIELEPLRNSEPWHAAMLVSQQLIGKLGYRREFGVEATLSAWASSDNKPIEGLETLAEQLDFFDSLSPSAQRQLLGRTLSDAPDLATEMAELVAAWKRADIAYLEAELYQDVRRFPELHQRLLVARNQTWLDQIERLEARSETYLVVVGALHLAGPRGLVAELKARGYTLTALPSADAQTSTISKSSLPAPQSGHRQDKGTSSQRVPGSIPASGSPRSSS